jgi:hypothetical protein
MISICIDSWVEWYAVALTAFVMFCVAFNLGEHYGRNNPP